MLCTVCASSPGGSLRGSEMDNTQKRPLKSVVRGLIAVLALSGAVLVVAAWGDVAGWGNSDNPLPEQSPEVVVEKFYEYISESKIRGGTMLVREAFKLTSGDQSRYGQAKFLEVINNYPAGFQATIMKTDIQEQHANVTIEYEMASSFGGTYKVNAIIPLIVDQETHTWKIDFRGDTDDQNLDKLKKEYRADDSQLTASKDAEK